MMDRRPIDPLEGLAPQTPHGVAAVLGCGRLHPPTPAVRNHLERRNAGLSQNDAPLQDIPGTPAHEA